MLGGRCWRGSPPAYPGGASASILPFLGDFSQSALHQCPFMQRLTVGNQSMLWCVFRFRAVLGKGLIRGKGKGTYSLDWHLLDVGALLGVSQVAVVVKNPPVNARDEGLIPGLGRSPGGEEGTATHSNILAWRSPWTEEPGGLRGQQRMKLIFEYKALCLSCSLIHTLNKY